MQTRAGALLLAALAAGAVAASAVAAPSLRVPQLPRKGELVTGVSLGGVRLGATEADVRSTWGSGFVRCPGCTVPTWYYTYPDDPVGAAVSFRRGKVVAVFTLGSVFGWRTREGLRVGELIERVVDTYPQMQARGCVGYSAFTTRSPAAVTSIYVFGEVVYGFALSRPTEPVCQ
ncbi:MAG TPA: hypothetical protein VIU86_17500 [Gaiellaceae bacterium]